MRKIIPYHTILNDQGIIIDKKKQNHTAEYIRIDQKHVKTSSSVKLLGVHIVGKGVYPPPPFLGQPPLF